MNKDIKNLADRLDAALCLIGAKVKRSQVYDLIAAARGLRNRELLKQDHVVPKTANVALLSQIAARIDADRSEAISDCISAIAFPTVLTCHIRAWMSASFEITADELLSPSAFIEGPRGNAGIKVISRNIYHSAYHLDRSDDGMDLPTANRLAEEILETKDGRLSVLEEHYGYGQSAESSVIEQDHEIREAIDAMRDLAEEIGIEIDEDEWLEALQDEIAQKLEEEDDSSVEDMIQSRDYAEMLFIFAPSHGYLDDVMINCDYRSCDPADIRIDYSFQFALAQLGYTIGEFRRFSGNAKEACEDLSETIVPRRRPLLPPGNLLSMLENAGDSYFHLALYLQVPISEVMNLDVGLPVTLKNASLCAYGMINGTFYDEGKIDEITLNPEDGRFIAVGNRYSPVKICDMYSSPFHGSAKNPPVEESVVTLPGHAVSDDQYRLAFAA